MTWRESIDEADGNMHMLGITKGRYASPRHFGNYRRAIKAGYCSTNLAIYSWILEELKKTPIEPRKNSSGPESDT